MSDHIDAIRKRRAAVKDPTYYDSDCLAGTYDILDEYAELYAAAPADIDWLLGEHASICTQNDALQAECGRLLAEVERLRAENSQLQIDLQGVQLQLDDAVDFFNQAYAEAQELRGEVERLVEERRRLESALYDSPLQQLTDLDQSRYEEAGNPLVKDDCVCAETSIRNCPEHGNDGEQGGG